MTTATLLGIWLLGTVLARPLTPLLAGAAVKVEYLLGLDTSTGTRKE